MKHLLITALFIVASMAGEAQNKTLTLKQCIDTAIANNLALKQSDLQMEAREVGWKQARANVLPQLNASASHGINQGRSIDPFTNSFSDQRINFAGYGVAAGLPLFNGLAIQQSIRQNSLSYQAAKMNVQQEKDNLTLNIMLAYLQVLSNEDLLEQSKNQVEVSRQQVLRLETLNSQGAIAPSLLSDLKGEQAGNELALINNRNAVESSKLGLFQLMNIEYDETLQVEKINPDELPASYPETAKEVYEKALNELGVVKAANLWKQSAEKGVQVAKGALYPSISLNGNLNTNYSSVATQSLYQRITDVTTDNYVVIDGVKSSVISPTPQFNVDKIKYNKQLSNNLYTTVSVDMRIPLFNAFSARNKIKLARIDLKNADYIAQSAKIQLRQTVEQAYVNMKAAHNRYTTTLVQVDAFSTSFRAAEVRFNAGVGTVVDYIIAKNNVDRANINLIIARYDYLLRTKALDYYQGKLVW